MLEVYFHEKISRLCHVHPNNTKIRVLILDNVSPFAHKLHCYSCNVNLLGKSLYRDCLNIRFSARNLRDFRDAYNRFDRLMQRQGRDLGFRQQLDEVVTTLVTEFASMSFVEMVEKGENVRIYKPEERRGSRSFVVEDRRLAQLTGLLDKLTTSFGFHGMVSVVRKVADFVDGFVVVEPEAVADIAALASAHPTTQALRKLFAKNWPIYCLEQTRLPVPASPSCLCPLSSSKFIKQRVGQLNKVAFDRCIRCWEALVKRSSVLRRSDIPFLVNLISLHDFQKLIQVDDESQTPADLRKAVEGRPDTLLLVKTPDRQFGHYSPNGFYSKCTKDVHWSFLFSLNAQAVFHSNNFCSYHHLVADPGHGHLFLGNLEYIYGLEEINRRHRGCWLTREGLGSRIDALR
jgi:hypothetical protein